MQTLEKQLTLEPVNPTLCQYNNIPDTIHVPDTEENRCLKYQYRAIGVVRLDDSGEVAEIRQNFLLHGENGNPNKDQMDGLLKDIVHWTKRKKNPVTIGMKHINIIKGTVLTGYETIYLPYEYKDHSSNQPTVQENIFAAANTKEDITVELLLVNREDSELSRYIYLTFHTRNVSVMELVHDFFHFDFVSLSDSTKQLPVVEKLADEEFDAGYEMYYYDSVGEKYPVRYSSIAEFEEDIVSMRVISMMHYINGKPLE